MGNKTYCCGSDRKYPMKDGETIVFDLDYQNHTFIYDDNREGVVTWEWMVCDCHRECRNKYELINPTLPECELRVQEAGTYVLRLIKNHNQNDEKVFEMELDFQKEGKRNKSKREVREEEKKERVNHPAHYNFGQIECIDYIEDQGMGPDFCLGNAIKYLTRSRFSGKQEEDLRKAIWYINRRLSQIENEKKE